MDAILPKRGDDLESVGSDQEEEDDDTKTKRDGPCCIA